jgi:hypothetical protein
MTKQVRIENADTASFKVTVQVWDKGPGGEPDRLAQEFALNNPCDMTPPGTYLTSTRYILVKETE